MLATLEAGIFRGSGETGTAKSFELVYNLEKYWFTRVMIHSEARWSAMEDEDTVVLTPEEKEKILKDVDDEDQEDEEEED